MNLKWRTSHKDDSQVSVLGDQMVHQDWHYRRRWLSNDPNSDISDNQREFKYVFPIVKVSLRSSDNTASTLKDDIYINLVFSENS